MSRMPNWCFSGLIGPSRVMINLGMWMVCGTECAARGWKSVICNAVIDTVSSGNQILTMALTKRDVYQENGSVLRWHFGLWRQGVSYMIKMFVRKLLPNLHADSHAEEGGSTSALITCQTEWKNSLEGTRDFKRESMCSNFLLLSLFASFVCFFVSFSFSCCLAWFPKNTVTNYTTKWQQQSKRCAIYNTPPLHVSITQRASCGGRRRWWGKAGNVTPTKKPSSCTDCFLYKQRESVFVTNTYLRGKKQNVHSTKERKHYSMSWNKKAGISKWVEDKDRSSVRLQGGSCLCDRCVWTGNI